MPGVRHSGAYGFRLVLDGAESALPGLVDLPAEAEPVGIACSVGPIPESVLEVDDRRARIAVKDLVSLDVDRAEQRVDVVLPEPPRPEAVVHPIATTPLAIISRWRGRAALHAGAVLHDGGAFAVCGGQGAGKSTALAMLGARGLPIVTDDLVVLDDGEVLAGPSCVDLRPDTADRFPEAEYLGVVGARERYRLTTPPAPHRVPLRGVFLLGWREDAAPAVEPLDLEHRVRLIHLLDYAAMAGLPRGEALLDLLALPMWHVTRPRTWDGGVAALDLLLETASAAAH